VDGAPASREKREQDDARHRDGRVSRRRCRFVRRELPTTPRSIAATLSTEVMRADTLIESSSRRASFEVHDRCCDGRPTQRLREAIGPQLDSVGPGTMRPASVGKRRSATLLEG
jgi:ribonuclease I